MSPPVQLHLSRLVMSASGSDDCHLISETACQSLRQRRVNHKTASTSSLCNWFPNRFSFAWGTQLAMALFAERGISCAFSSWRGIAVWPIETVSALRESNVQPSGEHTAWLLFLSFVTVCANSINLCPELKVWCYKFCFCHTLPIIWITFQGFGIVCTMRKP